MNDRTWWKRHRGLFAPLAVTALLILLYTLVSDPLRPGPSWFVPAVLISLALAIVAAHWQADWKVARVLALVLAGAATAAEATSVAFLVFHLSTSRLPPGTLLADAALLWFVNVVTFALWYWELDGGGPRNRRTGYRSRDFVFPQLLDSGTAHPDWTPKIVDYLFLAFTTSAAFGPTDTAVLSHRAKMLVMVQVVLSITILAVLAARAINTLR